MTVWVLLNIMLTLIVLTVERKLRSDDLLTSASRFDMNMQLKGVVVLTPRIMFLTQFFFSVLHHFGCSFSSTLSWQSKCC